MRLSALVERFGGHLIGDDVEVTRVMPPRSAIVGDLCFVQHPREMRRATLEASALLTSIDVAADRAHEIPCTVWGHDAPAQTLSAVLRFLHPRQERVPSVHPTAVVDGAAEIAPNVDIAAFAVVGRAQIATGARIGAHVFIDDDVVVGPGSTIGPSAVVMHGTRIGARCAVQAGAVVGDEGFGYTPSCNGHLEKVPQVGNVIVGDDVDIGTNACVDRGALDDTEIGAHTKIDNLTQVAHGVRLGEDVVVIAQAGLSGGAEIGDRALMAGQSACTQFTAIGEDARVGARGAVHADVLAREAVTGYPAIPHALWLKIMAHQKRLPRYAERLAQAEKKIAALEARLLGDPDD